MLSQRIEAVDALIAVFGHAENHFVLQQVHAAVAVHEVETLGIDIRRSGDVQLVHLLLTGGEEEVAVRALLNLGLQGAGGIEVEAERHAGVLCCVVLGDGVQGLGQGSCGEDDQLDGLAGSRLRGSGSGTCHGGSSAGGAAGTAAGSQGSRCGYDAGSVQEAAAGDLAIHCVYSLTLRSIYKALADSFRHRLRDATSLNEGGFHSLPLRQGSLREGAGTAKP